MTEAGQVKDKDRCPLSKHVDGKSHGWLFWGDDPYIKCDWCGEIRDALTGRLESPRTNRTNMNEVLGMALVIYLGSYYVGVERSAG